MFLLCLYMQGLMVTSIMAKKRLVPPELIWIPARSQHKKVSFCPFKIYCGTPSSRSKEGEGCKCNSTFKPIALNANANYTNLFLLPLLSLHLHLTKYIHGQPTPPPWIHLLKLRPLPRSHRSSFYQRNGFLLNFIASWS